jgi:biotin carboxyl carrier protein
VKLELDIDGRTIAAKLDAAAGRAQLAIDGRTHEAEVSEPEPGLFTVILRGRVYRCALDRAPDGRSEVTVNGRRVTIAVRDRKRWRGGAAGAAGGGGRATLTSPMPGKVVRVLCAVGDEVADGQGVLVVEAMKMQNELRAPRAGRVERLAVGPGDTIELGDLLVVIA